MKTATALVCLVFAEFVQRYDQSQNIMSKNKKTYTCCTYDAAKLLQCVSASLHAHKYIQLNFLPIFVKEPVIVTHHYLLDGDTTVGKRLQRSLHQSLKPPRGLHYVRR